MERTGDGRRRRPRVEAQEPSYPGKTKEESHDGSRRRFLRQIALGGGVLSGLGGVTGLRAQEEPEIDFSTLGEHATVPEAPARRARRRGNNTSREEARADSVEPPEEEVWVTEHRALWVDPGYLILIEWSRPASDTAPVASLEGSAAAVAALLSEQVTDPQALHDTERLFDIEQAVASLLAEAVAPARIDVLHLDHDCNVVCGSTYVEDPRPIVRGRRR